MTGTTWIEESGFLEGPVLLTNTHSVGVVRDAVIAWRDPAGRRRRLGLLVVAAGRGRDLGRLSQRHQRLSRQGRSTSSRRSTRRDGRPGGGGQRRRRDGDDLLRVQGRHRDRLAPADRAADGGVHGRRAGPVQLRPAAQLADRRRPGRPEIPDDSRRSERRTRLDHHRRRHRRPAPAPPVEAAGAAGVAGPGPHRQRRRATARATSSSPSRPPTRTRRRADRPVAARRCCPTSGWTRSSRRRCRRPRRRSSTRWSRPRR